jgi:hypothetical protein
MGEDPSEVRHEVEDARESLGETVEALAYKANAPRRIKDEAAAKLADAKARVEADPRTAKLKSGASAVKDRASAIGGNGDMTATGPRPSPRARTERAIEAIRRIPPTTAAATAVALLVGWTAGRKSGRRARY